MAERLRLWLERGAGGYYIRDAATGEPVGWEDPRLRVVPVAGVSFCAAALDDPSFEPGRRARARAGAPERARPVRGRDLQPGPDAPARRRPARGRAGVKRWRFCNRLLATGLSNY